MPTQVPQGLDPTAFFLTKAIKQTETGGSADQYTTPGKSGEYGAYQYTAPTWASDSQKYLGQSIPLEQATPAQQNQVAYSAIEDQLKQGKTQSQIASWWNSGNYDANAVGTGTNKYGVSYDVPGYVNKVKNNYQQIQQQFQGSANAPSGGTSPVPLQTGTPGQPSDIPARGNAPSLANVRANLQALPGATAGAVNAAFPITGDVVNDVTGNNNKTGLQQGGDLIQSGLTAALLVPGAQPADLAAKAGLEGITARIGANAAFGAGIGASGAVGQGQGTGQVLTQGLVGGLLGGGLGSVPEGINALSKNSDISTIVNKLMPNSRVSGPEVRAAMSDGRIIDGTKSTFWGSTPDTIAPRAKTIINAQTLQKNIPGIADMTPQNMVRAIDDTTDTALEGLQKPMQTVPVNPSDTGKVFDAWNQLKQTQVDNPHFYDAPSTAKMQTQFERYLNPLKWDIQDPVTGQMKSPTPKTLADVTQTLRDYDAAVDDDIKNLKPNADRTDRLQHKTWLQNRTLLTSLRDELGSRLPGGTQQVFKEVSNMLDARRAIVQNARISTKSTPGLVKLGAKHIAGGLIGSGLVGAGTLGLIQHLLPSQTPSQ